MIRSLPEETCGQENHWTDARHMTGGQGMSLRGIVEALCVRELMAMVAKMEQVKEKTK